MNLPYLAPCVRAYFMFASQQDVLGVLSCFDVRATVEDEGHTYEGTREIRVWQELVTAKYRPVANIIGAVTEGDEVIVSASVSGSFEGSPAVIRYAFSVHQNTIARLRAGV